MMKEYLGTVIWFQNQFGFISWSIDGVPQKDMFLHFSNIECEGFKTVKKDQKITFEIGTNNSGQPKAINVKIIS